MLNRFKTLPCSIKAVSSVLPDNPVQNSELDSLTASDKILLNKTLGIHTRYVEHKGRKASFYAIEAAKEIIDTTSIDLTQISYLIYVTQTPDFITPATSIFIQSQLELPSNCICFDINLGCSGYVYGLFLLAELLNSAGGGKGLLLTSDISSVLIKKGDTATEPVFSDGGSATLVEVNEDSLPAFFSLGNDGNGYEVILKEHPIWKKETASLTMKGLDVLNFSAKTVSNQVMECLNFTQKKVSDIRYFIPHQAGLVVNETLRKKCGYSESQTLYTFGKYGNTSSASVPVSLCHYNDLFKGSSTVMFSGFGVGLSYATSIITLTDPIFKLVRFL